MFLANLMPLEQLPNNYEGLPRNCSAWPRNLLNAPGATTAAITTAAISRTQERGRDCSYACSADATDR